MDADTAPRKVTAANMEAAKAIVAESHEKSAPFQGLNGPIEPEFEPDADGHSDAALTKLETATDPVARLLTSLDISLRERALIPGNNLKQTMAFHQLIEPLAGRWLAGEMPHTPRAKGQG